MDVAALIDSTAAVAVTAMSGMSGIAAAALIDSLAVAADVLCNTTILGGSNT